MSAASSWSVGVGSVGWHSFSISWYYEYMVISMGTNQDGPTRQLGWGHFTAYRLQGGRIVPSPQHGPLQATDPWGDYWRARNGRSEEPPPYQSLIRLIHRARRDGRAVDDKATVRAVTTWCGQHGPLGILPAQVREVAVVASASETIGEGSGGRRLRIPHPFRYLQTCGGWQKINVDPRHLPANNYVVIVSFDGAVRGEDPATTFMQFFPAMDEKALYLDPLSPAYWRAYGEPLSDFLDAGARLLAALEALERSPRTPNEEASAIMMLRRLLGCATREPVLRDGRVAWTWTVPSLISAFAGMILEDLAAERRRLRCVECTSPFLTDALRRYCSGTCRNTRLVRQRRARVRARGA
jgi:hypothetical protein